MHSCTSYLSHPCPNPNFFTPSRTRNASRVNCVSFKTRASSSSSSSSTVAPEGTQKERMSFYDLLGIAESGSLLDIKQAYKQLARKYHPDVSPPDRVEEYTKRFIRVQEAYETLSDPRRRAMYDKDMSKGILHLAFTARRRYNSDFDEGMDDRNDWRNRWQSQLSGLKRRSKDKDTQGNMSWGARMRRQQRESSSES